MQAPHCSVPQPNRLPRSASSSRSTANNGFVPSVSTLTALPLTMKVVAFSPLLSLPSMIQFAIAANPVTLPLPNGERVGVRGFETYR